MEPSGGGEREERRDSARARNLVSPCIYLPDTVNSAGPAANHPSSAIFRQNPNAGGGSSGGGGDGKDARLKSTWLID